MTNSIHIGKTDLKVNPIGLGAMALGSQNMYPQVTEETSRQVLLEGMKQGLNFIDTAFYYGFGRSEELIGEVLKEEGNRQDIILATKASHEFIGEDIVLNNRPEFLTKAVDDALMRLQTDYIDLFYIHNPDHDTPKEESVGALQRLKEQGKIRAIGISKFSYQEVEAANQDGYVDVYQGHYNLLEREAEKDLFPQLEKHNISFIPFYPFASGILAGKYDEATTFSDHRTRKDHLKGQAFKENLKKVTQLRPIANELGVEIAQLILAWYLKHPLIDALIPGATQADQVTSNLKAADIHLSNKNFKEIDQIFK